MRKLGSFLFMVVIFTLCMALFGFSGAAGAASSEKVTLAWDANAETDLAGYKLYYKSGTSGAPYAGDDADQGKSPIELPLASVSAAPPQYTLTGLSPETYFFAVTAYNTDGLESGFRTRSGRTSSRPPRLPGSGGFST